MTETARRPEKTSSCRRRRSRTVLGLLVGVALGVAACSGEQPPTSGTSGPATTAAPSTSTTSTPPPPPAPPALAPLTGGPVLAVKVDNTASSRPRIGLNQADVVYVEPVEAGLTRLLVIFSSSQPGEVGPIRSARESDVDLLANYGKVAFAFSGGSAGTLATVSRGAQTNLSFDASREGFRRDGRRPAPYNVIGDTRALLARAGGSVPPGDPGLRFGPALDGGTPGTHVGSRWQASDVRLDWDQGSGRYLVTTDGKPDIDADGTQHGAATVIVQVVPTHLGTNRDVNGVATPVIDVIGQGSATVLRGGKAWPGEWSRPAAGAPTSFTSGGKPVPMANGPVWILLVPQGQAADIS